MKTRVLGWFSCTKQSVHMNASTEAKEDRPGLSSKILDSLVVCSYSETLGTRIILVETPPNWII